MGLGELLFVPSKWKMQSKAGIHDLEPVTTSLQYSVTAAHFGMGQGVLLVMLLQHAGYPTVRKVEGQKENTRVCFIFHQHFVSPYAHNSGFHSLKVKSRAKDIG